MINEDDKVKILKKVKKLFKLASNAGSDSEAESAVLVAKQLLAKYDLEYGDVESLRDESCHEEKINLNYSYMPLYIRNLALALRLLYVCDFFWSKKLGRTRNDTWKESNVITFTGIQPDLDIVIHTFYFLRDYAQRKSKEYGFIGKKKTAYLNGFSIRIMGRFQEIAIEKSVKENTETGLCVIKNDIIDRYMKEFHPNFSTARNCPQLKWSEELRLGIRDANNVEINAAIDEQELLSLA